MDMVSDTNNENEVESVPAYQGRNRDYMNIKQLSEYLGIAISTIYSMSSKGTIPRTKLGNRVIFNKDEIDKWLKGKE